MNMFIKQHRVTQYNTKQFSCSNLLNVSNRGRMNRKSGIRAFKTISLVLTRPKLRLFTVCLCITGPVSVITHKALSTSVPPYIDELLQRQVTTRQHA